MQDSNKARQLLFWSQSLALHPYWEWEDYKAGMYKATGGSDFQESVLSAIAILSNNETCLLAMRRVIKEWPIAARQNFHDATVNRRPWLGRACCCIENGVREDAVRVAWWSLDDEQRAMANAIADNVIREWEVSYAEAIFENQCL